MSDVATILALEKARITPELTWRDGLRELPDSVISPRDKATAYSTLFKHMINLAVERKVYPHVYLDRIDDVNHIYGIVEGAPRVGEPCPST